MLPGVFLRIFQSSELVRSDVRAVADNSELQKPDVFMKRLDAHQIVFTLNRGVDPTVLVVGACAAVLIARYEYNAIIPVDGRDVGNGFAVSKYQCWLVIGVLPFGWNVGYV